jgi:2-oxoisovalerate dehydrogenase E1 component alpha subunit
VQILQAVQVAERIPKRGLAELFTDVYDQVPPNLREQQRSLLGKHPSDYPTEVNL